MGGPSTLRLFLSHSSIWHPPIHISSYRFIHHYFQLPSPCQPPSKQYPLAFRSSPPSTISSREQMTPNTSASSQRSLFSSIGTSVQPQNPDRARLHQRGDSSLRNGFTKKSLSLLLPEPWSRLLRMLPTRETRESNIPFRIR